MKFSAAFVLAAAPFILAAPSGLESKDFGQCSYVDCATDLDCHEAGCYACAPTGKCGVVHLVNGQLEKKQVFPPMACSAITCLSASVGPGGDDACAASGCGVCSDQGKCQEIGETIEKKQVWPQMACPSITCLAASFGPGGDETCAASGCGVCSPQGKCEDVAEAKLEKKQGAPLVCSAMTCLAASFGPGGDEACASQGCGACSAQGKCEEPVTPVFPTVPCYETTCTDSAQCVAGGCSGCTAQGKCF